MRTRAHLATILCLALSTAAPAAAAERDYVLEVWGTERGLPTSFVAAIAQTPDGYLWIATQTGLVRFDGSRFVTFDPDNTAALTHARVEHLFVDGEGTLWANTYDGSLVSRRDGAFRLEWRGSGPVEFEAFLAAGVPGRTVFVLDHGPVISRPIGTTAPWTVHRPPGGSFLPLFASDAAGALWLRSVDDRLWRLDGDRLHPVPLDGLAGRRVQSLARDPRGRVWVGTEAEIAVFDGGRFRTMTPGPGTPRLDVAQLAFDRRGDLWVVADGRARKARDRTWIWDADEGRGLTGQARQSVNLLEDQRGGVWFTHFGKGVLHVRPDGRPRWITDADGLPGNRIRGVLEDREGNIWLAIERGGLVRLRAAWFKTLTAAEPRGDTAVSSVAVGADGSLWIGSMGGGLQRYRDGVLTRFALPDPTAGGFVFSVQPDPSGRVWLSGDREDLYYLADGRVQRAPANVHGIKTMLIGRDGALWIGTKNGLSVLRDGRLSTFGPGDGFTPQSVRALARDGRGHVWVGASDGAIYRYADGRLTRFDPPGRQPGQAVWSLHADEDGSLWAGTFRGGLLRLRDGRFTRYTTAEGLPSNILCQVLDDGAGHLWVSSHTGIFRVAKGALTGAAPGAHVGVDSYGRSDGLPTLDCSGNYQPGAARSPDGRLWFSTPKGLVWVDPKETALVRAPPPAVLEEVWLDQRPVALPAAAPLRVPAGPRRLEFRYAGISFATPDRVRYRYRLDGLDAEWVDAGDQRAAPYGHLPPGDYRFRLAATHGDGRWSAAEATLALTVEPRFYELRLFQGTAGLLALLAVGGTARYASTRRLQRRLERLEFQRALERDRGRIARDMHDDMGAGLTQITLLSELAQREPAGDAAEHLGQISDTARELTRAMDEIVWAVDPRHDTLDGLVTYVCRFAQEYLTVAGIQCRLDVPAHLPPRAVTSDVRHNVFLAVKEALNNVVKHARAGVVWVRAEDRPRGFAVLVEDDGVGFDADAPAQRPADGRASNGHGLGNLHDRLAAIGGRCTVTSRPGHGTRVELEVGTA